MFNYKITISKKIFTRVVLIGMLVWLIVLFWRAENSFEFIQWIKNQFIQSTLIEEEYKNAAELEIVFPDEKRNLICIYVESAETSAQDIANGGFFENNYIPEMTELAKSNVSFSQSELIEGACVAPASGWTMAGLVAETAGVPLKMYDYNMDVDNGMGKYEYFLPGVVTLGDILEENGYTNYFMVGSHFAFGGREAYFDAHGNYEKWDYETAVKKGKIPEDL